MDSRTPSPSRAYWLKTLHQWHWISSAVCLLGMLLFSLTGITLNHASQIEASPEVVRSAATLPAALQARLAALDSAERSGPVPAELRSWFSSALGIDVDEAAAADWSPEEIYLALPRPGGDAWVRIDRETGEAEYERTDRGWVSYFNDLHKGRHTGVAWSWFIDVFAVASLLFSITGLFILKLHAANRPSTWPIVGLGVVIPVVLALLFIH
ncbi:MAG: PepSY-associated TM helix domain-containing protein [Rhizobacter sp.]